MSLQINHVILVLGVFFLLACTQTPTSEGEEMKGNEEKPPFAIVIHGGAGTIERSSMTAELEQSFRATLDSALEVGRAILDREKGTAIDAVEAVVMYLENDPKFNAGKGAVFTSEGTNELDASIMDGATGMAGAVTGVTVLKNPIRGARKVMEESEHVMLSGVGADQFCMEQGMERVDPEYFYTERRWNALQNAQKNDQVELDHDDRKHGTVGAVALDRMGNLAAATSTGGMTNKRYGRVGDSPIIGAGTYANNSTCAVSCTGHGEYFIRDAAAYTVSAQMSYANKTLEDATNDVIFNILKPKGGNGGMIAVDADGNVAMPFNTAGMYRGYLRGDEKYIGIYGDE